MLLNFKGLVKKYNLKITGIIQVGASTGQEVEEYERLGITNLILIEPCTNAFTELYNKYGSKYILFNLALADYDGEAEMFVSEINGGQSNSLLKPALHEKYYPEIVFDQREFVSVRKLDSIYYIEDRYNMLVMDCQGAELKILQGAKKSLAHFDAIYTELNFQELYEGCGLASEIDEYLKEFGFTRVETGKVIKNSWSDGLYIKSKV